MALTGIVIDDPFVVRWPRVLCSAGGGATHAQAALWLR
jgi:hypothetical protein